MSIIYKLDENNFYSGLSYERGENEFFGGVEEPIIPYNVDTECLFWKGFGWELKPISFKNNIRFPRNRNKKSL